MNEKIIYTGKLHWIAYVRVIVFNFIVMIVLMFVLNLLLSRVMSHQTFAYSSRFALMIILFFIIKTLIDFLNKSATKIVLTTEKIYSYKGYFSWQKVMHMFSYEQIFECYYNPTFIGTLFGYGTLTLAEADGTRTPIQEGFFDSPATFRNTFEKTKRESKMQHVPMMNTTTDLGNANFVEQLGKLIAMKESGHISETEFEVMKQRL